MRCRRFWFALAFIVHILPGYTQPSSLPDKNIFFSKLPENLGLSQTSINSILQDRHGFLWVGTWSGLIRYDGYLTQVFHSGTEGGQLQSNLISSLFEDHNGDLWIGTHVSGLFHFDSKTERFTNYRAGGDNAISNNNIWDVVEDANHNLWIATENGLNFYDRAHGIFRTYRHAPDNIQSLSDNFVTDLFFDSSGELWVATNFGLNKLVLRPDGDAVFIRYIDPSPEPANNFVYQVTEVVLPEAKEIWFITKKGLKKIENQKVRNFTVAGQSPNHSLFRSMLLVPGTSPQLLLGSAVDLSLFDVKKNQFSKRIPYTPNEIDGGESMAATALYMDRGGVLWVGTKKGLYKYDTYADNIDLTLTNTFDRTNSIITGIQFSAKGYWLSTIGGGLFHASEKIIRPVPVAVRSRSDFAPFVQALYAGEDNDIWMATAGAGIIRCDGGAFFERGSVTAIEHYHMQSSTRIADDYIMSLTKDQDGSVWAGTWDGYLIHIKEKKVDQFERSKFGATPIVVLHVDNSGALWIGTRGNGVFCLRMKDNKWETIHYQSIPGKHESLPNNFINVIYEDHAGAMWLGTEGGLVQFDRRRETFRPYPIKDGPANRVIVGILEDDFGKLWCSHWNGITVVDPTDSLQQNVRSFDVHDRIQGGFFYNNVALKDASGNLLFGGSNGFNTIRPERIITNPLSPNVVVTEVKINNTSIRHDDGPSAQWAAHKAVHTTSNIEVRHFQNNIAFEFTALDFAAPEKIRYAYQLEGFDQSWTYADGHQRTATYTNIPDGKYTFRVKSTNNDGLWKGVQRSITLVVRPPWWKTTYAFAAYLAIGFLLLYAFRRMVLMRANYRHEIKLERVRSDEMEKLNRAKLQFFTNISHEFRTPLTLILGPSQELIDSGAGSKREKDLVYTIQNNAQRLLRLINQLLDFRKVESGNLGVKAAPGNLVRFANEIKLSFDNLAQQLHIQFDLQASSNVIEAYFDPDHFEKILFNLLSNAFKHTPEKGAIHIVIREHNESITLAVTNTGKGIRKEHFDTIFQSFFSYDEEQHHAGTGIGLALVKSLVEAHHGKISVDSGDDGTTTFHVELQKGHAHFLDIELSSRAVDHENIAHYADLDGEGYSPSRSNNVAQTDIRDAQTVRDLPTLLIVEDNDEVRQYLKSIFLNEYVVLEAANGKDGLELAESEIPDVVVSDVMMPLMDGISLCRELKSSIKTSHIPILLLTARTSLIFKVEGLETGADDYVVKPFSAKVLQLKIKNILRTRDALKRQFTSQEVLEIEPSKVTLNSTDEIFLNKVIASVEKNMSNAEYTVEHMVQEVGMSRMQLYRKLKAVTGQSANELIRTLRLKRAAQLLVQKQLTIAEVTYAVGFNDLQYFRESFKKYFGMTPSEYEERGGVKA
jgi:signal transduction histidine kinase/ligand-binding sensor domain-containing protein/DNA-binding response OmpR family regulator